MATIHSVFLIFFQTLWQKGKVPEQSRRGDMTKEVKEFTGKTIPHR